MAHLGLSGCPTGAIWAGDLPSPPATPPPGALPAAALNAGWCSPAGQGLWMGHFLDSDSTWQVAASSGPARPASRTRVSRPQAEPHVFPLCVQGLQLLQGPSSHSSVGWREGQTDRQIGSAGRECPADPRAGSGGLKTSALTRSRAETLHYLLMMMGAWEERQTKASRARGRSDCWL